MNLWLPRICTTYYWEVWIFLHVQNANFNAAVYIFGPKLHNIIHEQQMIKKKLSLFIFYLFEFSAAFLYAYNYRWKSLILGPSKSGSLLVIVLSCLLICSPSSSTANQRAAQNNWMVNAQQCFADIYYHWTQGCSLPCVQPLRTQLHGF